MPHEPHRNRRTTVVLLAGAVALPAIVGLLIGLLVALPVLLLVVGLVLGVALAGAAWLLALGLVLDGVGARALDGAGSPSAPDLQPNSAGIHRLENLVEGLCAASGVPRPRLHLVEDEAPNALAAGVQRRKAAIVVTTGLLDTLSRVELEGVVGHLLARIRRDDIVPATLAAFLLGPLAAKVVSSAAALDADAAAVVITRYPPGLAAALTKLRDDPRPVNRCPRASLPLWVAPPAARGSDPDPDLDHRIAVLREL